MTSSNPTPSAENSYTQRRLKEFDEKFKSHHYGVFKDGAYYNPEYLPLTIENIKDFLSNSIQQAEQRTMKENKALQAKLETSEVDNAKLKKENLDMRDFLGALEEYCPQCHLALPDPRSLLSLPTL